MIKCSGATDDLRGCGESNCSIDPRSSFINYERIAEREGYRGCENLDAKLIAFATHATGTEA
jgi:hypothetical protein